MLTDHSTKQNTKQTQFYKTIALAWQKLLQEIIAKGDAIEELNDACEVLVEYSTCSKVRDQAIDMQKQYTKLLTTAQGEYFGWYWEICVHTHPHGTTE